MTNDQKGRIHRAATRTFRDGFELKADGTVKHKGQLYRFSFLTGRFYGTAPKPIDRTTRRALAVILGMK